MHQYEITLDNGAVLFLDADGYDRTYSESRGSEGGFLAFHETQYGVQGTASQAYRVVVAEFNAAHVISVIRTDKEA